MKLLLASLLCLISLCIVPAQALKAPTESALDRFLRYVKIDTQSQETNTAKRKQLVWEIDKKLQEDGASPIIAHERLATCWQPPVKGLTIMVNSVYNGWRFEDVWLDR